MNLEQEILAIKDRNRKVEADKAWEVSTTRKIIIAVLTYIAAAVFLIVADVPHPYMSAFIPSAAFLLSTLSLPWFKQAWIKIHRGEK